MRPLRSQAALSLMELTFAVAIFSAFAVVSIYSLTQFNQFATTARYKTLALACAQQKMDRIMTVSWSIGGTKPAELTTGTTTEPNLPLNNDSFNSEAGLSGTMSGTTTASSLDTLALATRTTVITPVAGNPRLLSAMVTVTYTYRGNRAPITITMNGMRASDDF